MGLMSEFAKDFNKALGDAVSASSKDNLKPLEDLLEDQRLKQRQVNLKPYDPPEDRYEDMANDYGHFLYEHHRTACNMVMAEIEKLEKS
jgi:hypothetical protein